jgi:arylsulfatase A-like enzyme
MSSKPRSAILAVSSMPRGSSTAVSIRNGLGHKIALYEASVRVPLCIRYPGSLRRGQVVHHLVSNGLDLLPMICGIVGNHTGNELEGDRTGVIRGGTYEGSARYPIMNTALQGTSLLGYVAGNETPAAEPRAELIVETNHRGTGGRLRREGMRFDNEYCPSPLCVLSRMSFMTSRYPCNNRVWTNEHILASGPVAGNEICQEE